MNFPKKTSLAIATFVLVAAGLEYGPGPSWLRLRKTRILEAFDFGPVSGAFPQGPAKASPTARTADRKGLAKTPVRQQDVRQIADPSGAMAHFYEALARTERREPGAITQVLHYGDSPVTADSITADARAILLDLDLGQAGFRQQRGKRADGFGVDARLAARRARLRITLLAHVFFPLDTRAATASIASR